MDFIIIFADCNRKAETNGTETNGTEKTFIQIQNQDVYLNIVGGFKLDEPAGDLSVALAVYSGYFDIPISEKLIAFGEIGLGGEVRNTSNISQRITEAERLGFSECIIPKHSLRNIDPNRYNMHIYGVSSLKQAFSVIRKSMEETT